MAAGGRTNRSNDLGNRLLFTLAVFLIFRLGVYIPTPGVNAAVVAKLVGSGSIFGLLNLFSGGALGTFSVLAMGVMPYINASIIMQLLGVVFPRVEEMQKEGFEGQKRFTQYTRYLTVVLGLLQATGVTVGLVANKALYHPGLLSILTIVVTLAAGTVFLMWLGELITERGVGNGISLIIFSGIIAGLPGGLASLWNLLGAGAVSIINVGILVVISLVMLALVVFIYEGERRVPVQYAKRVVGRRMLGGQASYIPIKVNTAGVIPVIFAISLLALPATLAQFWAPPWLKSVTTAIGFGGPVNLVLEFALVVIFTFFYTAIVFKPDDIADNIKKYGGFIPGFRPGKPTAEYLSRVSGKLTVLGALFLGFVAILPTLVMDVTHIPNVYFGGTALLIVVGVALDTMKQIEAYRIQRQYQGFMK